jgi:hypothetical protein
MIPLIFLMSVLLPGAQITEANLQTLFNSADACLANASIINLTLDRYTCCNALEQTYYFINNLDLTQYSPELQQHAQNLQNQMYPYTLVPNGIGSLGPITDGVAQGCIPPGIPYADAPEPSETLEQFD